MLVASVTGWTERELLRMPEHRFAQYLRLAVRFKGMDPDADGGGCVASEGPPLEQLTMDDLGEEVQRALNGE